LTVDPTIDPTVEITGQPVSRTQATDASARAAALYEAKCVERTRFQWGAGPFARRYQGHRPTLCLYTDTTRKAIDCATTLPLTVFYNETLQQTSRPLLWKLYERRQI